MSTVLLVRHAQASFGIGRYDRLSELGGAQAARLGEVLRSRGFVPERVVCGGLERQRATAQWLSSTLRCPEPEVDRRWDEFEHAPLLAALSPRYRWRWALYADLARSGDPGARFQLLLERALTRWAAEPDGARERPEVTTFAAYQARVTAALSEVAAQPGVSVVVSSAGTITAALAPLLGVPPTGWVGLQRVMVNTSVSKVVAGRRGITLVTFNEHGHLEGVPSLAVTYR